MCPWGSLGESPGTPGKDPEQPTPLGDLGPAPRKGHHEQCWLGKPRGAEPASVGAGDSQASAEPARGPRRGPREDHPCGMAGKSPGAVPDLFPGHPPLSQLYSCSPAQGEQKCSSAPVSPSSHLLLHHPLPPRTNPALPLGSAPSQPAGKRQGWCFMATLGIPHRGQAFNVLVGTGLGTQPAPGTSHPSFTHGQGPGRQCTHTPPQTPSPCHHRGPHVPRLSSRL